MPPKPVNQNKKGKRESNRQNKKKEWTNICRKK